MFAIKRTIKYLFSKLITLKFLERISQNKIWREILEEKKTKIVSSEIGKLDDVIAPLFPVPANTTFAPVNVAAVVVPDLRIKLPELFVNEP